MPKKKLFLNPPPGPDTHHEPYTDVSHKPAEVFK